MTKAPPPERKGLDGEWKLAFPLGRKEYEAERPDVGDASDCAADGEGTAGHSPRRPAPARAADIQPELVIDGLIVHQEGIRRGEQDRRFFAGFPIAYILVGDHA